MNQSLVDDFLVNSDKIGSSNFFWSFPSKHGQDLKRKRDLMLDTVQSSGSLDEKLENALSNRSHPDRKAKMQKLRSLLEEDKELDIMIQKNKENDPAELQRILKQVAMNKESVNRWTDNIWAVKKFLTKSKGLGSKEADKFLKINAGFDYV